MDFKIKIINKDICKKKFNLKELINYQMN